MCYFSSVVTVAPDWMNPGFLNHGYHEHVQLYVGPYKNMGFWHKCDMWFVSYIVTSFIGSMCIFQYLLITEVFVGFMV